MAFASCEKVAGEHHGRFKVDKREDVRDSGRPDYFDGTWTITVDGATCAISGQADSAMTGVVALTGTYGVNNADTSKFKVTNLYMDAAGNADFIEFSFKTDSARHLLHYVTIETAQYLYDGDFDGK